MRTRHYSRRTEEAYLGLTKRFILFHRKRHPATMGAGEVNVFLSHVAVERNVSASTQAQALSALVFLYRQGSFRSFWRAKKCGRCLRR